MPAQIKAPTTEAPPRRSATALEPVEVSAMALARVRAENLPPTPQVYALWYDYYSGAVPDVVRAVDILLASGQPVTEKRCAEIVERLANQGWDAVTAQATGQSVRAVSYTHL